MSETMKKRKWFSVAEWKKEEDYLSLQHKHGWKLVKISGIYKYHFERCEPEDVVYQLDYRGETTDKEEYIQMFSDCGWEYIQDFNDYSYFRKPTSQMQGKEEIFCDDASRLDMIKRVFKGRIIPLLSMFFLIILPNVFLHRSDDSVETTLTCIFIVMFFIYLIIFIQFGIHYYKCIKVLEK